MPSLRTNLLRPAAILFASAFAGVAFGADPLVVAGVGNFHKVDDNVYRGAQPTDDGFRNLARLGIKTVVDLREFDQRSREEEAIVKAAGMRYINIPMRGMETPSNESVLKALGFLEDTSTGAVFVHCMRGADRTGNVIACYRVEHDHWKNDRALAEARSLGMSWFEKSIQHFVLRYQPRSLDAAPATTLATATAPSAAGPPSQDQSRKTF